MAVVTAATFTALAGQVSASIVWHGWRAWVPALKTTVDRANRPGQLGSVAQGILKQPADVEAEAWRFCKTQAEMLTFMGQVELMPSPSPWRLVDAYGRTMKVRVVAVDPQPERVAGPPDGTTPTRYKVAVKLTLERLPDA